MLSALILIALTALAAAVLVKSIRGERSTGPELVLEWAVGVVLAVASIGFPWCIPATVCFVVAAAIDTFAPKRPATEQATEPQPEPATN